MKKTPTTPQLYSLKQASMVLFGDDSHVNALRDRVKRGSLPEALKWGGRYFIRRVDLERLIGTQPSDAEQAAAKGVIIAAFVKRAGAIHEENVAEFGF